MTGPTQNRDTDSLASTGSPLARLVKITLVVLGVIVVAFVLVVWLNGDQTSLPFDYDGFN